MKMVTTEMRKTTFAGMNFLQIRNALEAQGLDRHMPIELESTEVALITPEGIILQVRAQNEGIGLWGGSIEWGETPLEGAVRELAEETGLLLKEEQFTYMETHKHSHTYPNQDKAIFTAYRYVVRLEYIPEIRIDEESTGYVIIKELIDGIMKSDAEFVKQLLSSD